MMDEKHLETEKQNPSLIGFSVRGSTIGGRSRRLCARVHTQRINHIISARSSRIVNAHGQHDLHSRRHDMPNLVTLINAGPATQRR